MSESIENARKSSKSKVGYYVLGIFLIVGLFIFLLIYVSNKIDKSLEGSNEPVLKEINKISGNMDEIKSGVEDGELRMDSLDEMVSSNKSEVQLLRDSLYLLNKEIKSLNSKVNSLVQWQKEQKELNEYWGGKTLELIDWRLDLEDAAKLKELNTEQKRLDVDSVSLKVDTVTNTSTSNDSKKRKGSGWYKRG